MNLSDRYEIETDEYAIRPTPANYLDYPLYHVSKPAQARQLHRLGFPPEGIQCWDDTGKPETIEEEDLRSGNFHYAAMKR